MAAADVVAATNDEKRSRSPRCLPQVFTTRDSSTDGQMAPFSHGQTLEGYRTGILNWYDYPISSGPLEGINNKIGAMQRMAYGYKDKDYFIAKLYALHLAKFALIG